MNAIIPAGVQRIQGLRNCMEEGVKRGLLEEFEPPVEHLFANGLYARRNYVNAGITVITKTHLSEHITIVLTGKCVIYDQSGERKTVEAPQVFVTKPGTLRAIYCETDTSWVTVHTSDTNSVAEIEDEIFADTYEDYQMIAEQKLLEVMQ